MLLNSQSKDNNFSYIYTNGSYGLFGKFTQSLLNSNVYVIWQAKISDNRLPEVSKEQRIAALLATTTAIQPTTSINQTHIHVLEFGRGG